MNSSDFCQCWTIPRDISQQPYSSQTYQGTLNMILVLAPVSPALSGIYFRESTGGGCALIRFPGGGSMTQGRAGTCFYFIDFCFFPCSVPDCLGHCFKFPILWKFVVTNGGRKVTRVWLKAMRTVWTFKNAIYSKNPGWFIGHKWGERRGTIVPLVE